MRFSTRKFGIVAKTYYNNIEKYYWRLPITLINVTFTFKLIKYAINENRLGLQINILQYNYITKLLHFLDQKVAKCFSIGVVSQPFHIKAYTC